jgi:uncharacterized protein DUF4012
MAAGAAILVLLTVLALAVVSALGVRRHLQDGRDFLVLGKSALLEGDAAAAGRHFATAAALFRDGADAARSPWLRVVGALPLVGRTPDTLRAVADAGVETADAAAVLTGAVAGLPGGLGGLAPTAGGVPIRGLAGLTGALQRADELTGHALELLDASRGGLVPSSVAGAREGARGEIANLHRQLHAGWLILQRLPSFLGADGPRRYFFGASNPAELRGTGGLIGAYSILTIDAGRLEFSDFRPVQSLPRLDVDEVPSPSEEYSRNFDFYRTGVGFWLNVNMTPDFPLAARAMWLAYREATGETLDGVIVADPFALKALMSVTDPIPVGTTGVELTERNIVGFVTNRAYARFDTNEERKLVLGRVAAAVLQGFLRQEGDALTRLRALALAFAGGHVKAWSIDRSMQRGLALTTVGGAFRPSGTDAVAVVTNSASGTKLDFYQERTVTYEVELGPAGTATASLAVELRNDSPTSGFPRYVIGPYKDYTTKPGENVAVVHLYCDSGCILRSATDGGRPVRLGQYEQAGRPFFEEYVRTDSGASSSIAARLFLPTAWEGGDTGGTYRLSVLGQTMIRPAVVRVVIHPPDGMHVTRTGGALEREGDALIYEGIPRGDLHLEASFAPPLLVRVWRGLVDPLT